FELGYMAGEQAIEILVNGADVAAMPIGYLPAERCELTVNKTTADALGIDISGLENAVIVE
ncbi:MAG: ABC transporter substrate-binding protein, partial [Lachnospiraceae bacterium]|nr:ABC transporter substrate-binding protein [Lachnospiraceae bacterium]